MDIASQQINIEAARLLFTPALIAASAAVWLVLTSGVAGHIVLRVEAISAGFRVPAPPPAPAPDTVAEERHEATRHHPTCTRSHAEPQPGMTLNEEPHHVGPIALTPYLRIDSPTFELGEFRPSVSRARGERGPRRRHQVARRAPYDEKLVAVGAPPASEQRHRRTVTER